MDYVGGSTYLGAWHSFKLSVNVGGCYYHCMFPLLSAAEGRSIYSRKALHGGCIIYRWEGGGHRKDVSALADARCEWKMLGMEPSSYF